MGEVLVTHPCTPAARRASWRLLRNSSAVSGWGDRLMTKLPYRNRFNDRQGNATMLRPRALQGDEASRNHRHAG